ncbi:MAG: outer membrane beta-barrel family protein, partial [Duncaniella sp.]|nr:outer membrane beta-barrel family protein [Duncaniella sp.]
GNPALRDERMHDIQFFGMLNGFMLQADFTRSIDTYAFVKRLYPADNLQLIMQPINLDVSALDIYFIWSGNIRVWSPNFTIGAHKQWLRLDGTTYDRPIFSYYLENLFTLPYGYQLTLNIHGQSRGDMHTNRFGTTLLSTDASVSKSFLNKSLTVKLSATDIFNTANNDWTMNTYGIFVDKRQSYDRRGISLAVTYRFQPRQSKYKGKNASESEMNRL